jgi:perosamine synthetase
MNSESALASKVPLAEEIYMAGPWITEHEVAVVLDALRNGWYGKQAYFYCEKFETDFARFHQRKFALMTPNCTSAIHLLLAGLGIKAGDEVVVPECTWIATSAPINYVGATPVFADIDPVHWCLTPESLEAAITPRTKAVIVVDLFGNMPDMAALREVAERHGIALIEDSAEALGSRIGKVRAGKFGVGSVFSFHRTKTITTGEGGMVLLDDDDLFARCKFLRDHGRVEGRPYYNTEVAFKYMPFNIQAALGYAQFQRLDELVERKRWIWRAYREKLADVPELFFNPEPEDVYNSVWCVTLVFGPSHNLSKARAIEKLAERGLPARPFFYPLTTLPAYSAFADQGAHHPVAYDVSGRGINLPSAFSVTEPQIDAMCEGIRSVLGL